MANMNFGAGNVASAVATFGGQVNPYCNYTSQYAKGWVYRNRNAFTSPLRNAVFKLKVRTAAEIRFSDVTKRYMAEKLDNKRLLSCAVTTNPVMIDHMGSIVPKDEYEVKKMTAYLMSGKASPEFRQRVIDTWLKILFIAEGTNMAGHFENAYHQGSRIGTEEEFIQYLWGITCGGAVFAMIVTIAYWYYKYGQGWEVLAVN